MTVGKAKRVRSTLSWSLDNDLSAGEMLVELLISSIQGWGGFRRNSANYVGDEAIENARCAFQAEGYSLSEDGTLAPAVLENLSTAELTAALTAYAQRARKGVLDAALLAGTGKDLLEAVAAHVLVARGWEYRPQLNFPAILGFAFVALDMATPEHPLQSGEPAIRHFERVLYQLGCAVNTLRNKEGTGHGRPFLPSISQPEALSAVQAMGIVADYMLRRLDGG